MYNVYTLYVCAMVGTPNGDVVLIKLDVYKYFYDYWHSNGLCVYVHIYIYIYNGLTDFRYSVLFYDQNIHM